MFSAAPSEELPDPLNNYHGCRRTAAARRNGKRDQVEEAVTHIRERACLLR